MEETSLPRIVSNLSGQKSKYFDPYEKIGKPNREVAHVHCCGGLR